MTRAFQRDSGYSIIELMVATVLFTIIAGTIFSLLFSAQLRYRSESDLTTAFQQANVTIDQITRDVHSAGYPPPGSFSNAVQNNPAQARLMALPFAWSAGYPTVPCRINASCGAVPGDNDLILETDTGDGNGVQWIRYSLQGTTLMRGVVPKVSFADPVASTSASLVPYLENVQNGSLPIFSYFSGNPLSLSAVTTSDIKQVNILLIVQSAQPDPQTGQFRKVTLTGQAVCFNTNN